MRTKFEPERSGVGVSGAERLKALLSSTPFLFCEELQDDLDVEGVAAGDEHSNTTDPKPYVPGTAGGETRVAAFVAEKQSGQPQEGKHEGAHKSACEDQLFWGPEESVTCEEENGENDTEDFDPTAV